MRFLKPVFLLSAALILAACDQPEQPPETEGQATVSDSSSESRPATPKLDPSAFKVIEWTDLMPPEDLEALSNPPSYLNEIEDGSPEDQISNQLANAIASAADDEYQQALVSTKVVPEMDGKPIRVPGFIVPLEFDDEQNITQFFLVPFFGACIHVPPPPPNQIILVSSPEPFQIEALYDPFWISGILKTELTSNDIATSTYSMEMQYMEMYTLE
jgi:hypothetical protein